MAGKKKQKKFRCTCDFCKAHRKGEKMKYLIIIIALMFVSGAGWAGEHLVIFTDLPDTYIDFDFAQNKWTYHGDLDAIGKEIEKNCPYSYQPLALIEIYRQLREEENRKGKEAK